VKFRRPARTRTPHGLIEVLRLLTVVLCAGLGYEGGRMLEDHGHGAVLGPFGGVGVGIILGSGIGYVLGGVFGRSAANTADRTEVALAAAKRDGSTFAVLFLNLDRFNHINETLGRVLGDRVLLDVAERIKGCVRGVDTIARLGGDEFVVLAHQADDSGAHATATRLLDALKRPFEQGGMSFTVTASIGVALHPGDGASLDELLRRADGAMREVKHAGRAG